MKQGNRFPDMIKVLQHASDGIVIVTTNGFIQYYNRAFADIVALDNELDYAGKSLMTVQPEEVHETIREALDDITRDRTYEKTFGHVYRDGKHRTVHVRADLIDTLDPPVIVAVIRDVTELAKAQDELKRYQERLEELVDSRTAKLRQSNELLTSEVTERQRTAAALQEKEITVRALLNATPDCALLLDLDFTVVAANETVAHSLGMDPAVLVGSRIFDLFPTEVFEQRKARSWQAIQTGLPDRFIDQRDGRWYDTSVYPVFDALGNVVRLAIFAHDITEHKQADEALRESEIKYRTLVEQALEGIAIAKDNPLRLVFANEAMAKLTGYSVDELTALTVKELEALVHEDDRAMFFARFRDRLQGKEPLERYEFRAVRKDGSQIWAMIFSSLIEYEGEPAVFATFSDVTSNKRAEQALRESEEKLKAQYRSIPIPTYTWRNEGDDFVLVDYNDAVEQEMEGKAAALKGRRVSELLNDRPEIVAEMLRCFRERTTFESRMLYRYKTTGKENYLQAKMAYVPPDQILVHAENVTGKVKAEEELRVYGEQLENLVEERTAELKRVNEQLRQEIAERARAERELERRNRELGILNDINRFINLSSDSRAILKNMLETLVDFCGMAFSGMYEVDDEKSKLRLIACHGLPGETRNRIKTVAIDEDTLRSIIDADGLVVVEEDAPQFAIEEYTGLKKELGLKRTIVFPIRIKGHTAFLVLLGSRQSQSLSAELRLFLGMVANQLGIALERLDLLKTLEKREKELRKYTAGLIESIEEEKRKLALSLHDDLGQSLAAIKYEITGLEKKLPPENESCLKSLRRIGQQVQHITDSTRQNAYSLHPAMLEDLGLIEALKWYVDRFVRNDTLDVDFRAIGFDERIPDQVRLTLYRVAQEALTNVVRHADANRLSIKLTKGYPRVIMVIEDNGIGFTLNRDDATTEGLGIVSMRERVERLGGDFFIRSVPQGGTRIRVTLPLEADSGDQGKRTAR